MTLRVEPSIDEENVLKISSIGDYLMNISEYNEKSPLVHTSCIYENEVDYISIEPVPSNVYDDGQVMISDHEANIAIMDVVTLPVYNENITVIDGLPERNLSQNFKVCNFMCNNDYGKQSGDESRTKPKEKSGKCHNGNTTGHWKPQCTKSGDGAHSNNANSTVISGTDTCREEISSDENGLSNSNYFLMKKFDVINKPVVEQKVKAKKAVHYTEISPRVLAASVDQIGPPLPVIKASFIVEGRYICDFEMDNVGSTTSCP